MDDEAVQLVLTILADIRADVRAIRWEVTDDGEEEQGDR
jgi:hypothetical protein